MARLVPLGGEAAGEGWAEGAGAEPRGPGGKLVRWEPTTKHAKGTKAGVVGKLTTKHAKGTKAGVGGTTKHAKSTKQNTIRFSGWGG